MLYKFPNEASKMSEWEIWEVPIVFINSYN
jgi:hypothetical protein